MFLCMLICNWQLDFIRNIILDDRIDEYIPGSHTEPVFNSNKFEVRAVSLIVLQHF